MLIGHGELVALRQLHDHAQRPATRNDGGLVDRVGVGDGQGDQGVATLVIGGHALFIFGHDHRLALSAHHDLVLGVFEILHRDHAPIAACGHQGRFIDQIGQISAGKAGGATCDGLDVDIRRQGHIAHMDAQDGLAAGNVGIRHHDLAVKTAWAQKGRIEHVRTVGRRDQNDPFIGLKAVHLDQKLVEGLFALIIAAAKACTAMTTDSVDLVDKDDAGRVLLGLFEHVAHPAGTDADKHLDKVRAGNAEEGHTRLTGNGTGEQGLTRTRRADQQRALGDLAAKLLELAGVLEELNDLVQLFLGLVDTGHIVERDLVLIFGQQPRLGLAKAHGPARAALHLTHEEDIDADQQQDRQGVEEQAHRRDAARRLDLNVRAAGLQALDQFILVHRGDDIVAFAAGVLSLDHIITEHSRLDLAAIHLAEQLRIADLADRARLGARVHGAVDPKQDHNNDTPDGQITQIHGGRLF